MKLLFIGRNKETKEFMYGVDEKVIKTSKEPITPAELVQLCRESEAKITVEQYSVYIGVFIREAACRYHMTWTRESTNVIIAMLEDEDYFNLDSSLYKIFDSDVYPLEMDLHEVIVDTKDYKYEVVQKS